MAIQTIITTLRHAHTHYNAQRRYAGSRNIPLSEEGIHDALETAERLKRTRFDVVVTSKLGRAIQTARILRKDSAALVQTALCNERRFGVMEGLTWDEVQDLQPPILMISVGNDLHTVNPKGGEPFEDVWDRAKRFRRFLFRKYRGKNILVVSHGVFLQMFHGLLQGLSCIESLASYPLNMELRRFRFRGDRLVNEAVLSLRKDGKQRW